MKEKRKSPVPGLAIKNAIQKLDGAELIVLCANLATAYSHIAKPNEEGFAWSKALERLDSVARESLLLAFKVKTRHPAKSPAVQRAEAGIESLDPVVRAVSGVNGVYLTEGGVVPSF